MRMVVVLPQPEGPTRTASSPRMTSRDSSCTATVPSGNVLPTCSSRIIGSEPENPGSATMR